jgi:ORF6N domain-containing protein
MPKPSNKLTTDKLGQLIYEVRGERVMLDSDLASIYGVKTKALNRAVKRNRNRFPKDFVFQLSDNEWKNLRYQIGTSSSNRKYPAETQLSARPPRRSNKACPSTSRASLR